MKIPQGTGNKKPRLEIPRNVFPPNDPIAAIMQYAEPAGPPSQSPGHNILQSLLKTETGGPTVNGYAPNYSAGNNSGSANAAERLLGIVGSAPSATQQNGSIPGGRDTGSGGGVSNVDYQKAASDIYAPALNYLTSAEGQAKTRNRNNDKELASMYAGLVKSIAGDAGGIAGNYNDSIKQIAQSTQDTQGAIDNTYDSSADELASMLKNLGIQAAAPDVLKQNTRDEAFFKNMVGTSGKSVEDMLAQQRAGALEYNTAQKNISRQSGVDARANNMLSLEDTLRQIAGQRSDLQTEINKSAMQMQSSAVDQQMKQMQDQRDYEMQQARLALDTAKFQASGSSQGSSGSSSGATSADDPWGKLASVAANIYPNEEAAGNAMQAIRDTVTRGASSGQEWATPNQFINAVLSRNKGANDSAQLTQLASYIYKLLYSGQRLPY